MSRLLDEDDGASPDLDLLGSLDDTAGPARRLSRQRSTALVRAALLATVDAPSPPSRPRRRFEWWLSGGLLVVGAAAAAGWQVSRGSPPLTQAHVDPVVMASPHVDSVPAEPPAVTQVAVAPAVRPSHAEVARERSVMPAPEDLLRRANAHRADGQWKAAEALYLRVIRSEPRGMPAYVARVASGALRLEHLGDARGALRQYEEALRGWPEGLLAEEAGHGVAEAFRALGDTTGEARALESFLQRHPDSPHGVAARMRLREISTR
ncbi:tetratricopeptide repeat protein [Myxococcus landrumensis]|uniref:Tetratricopeptide repeat protein n=1 Tax=Myxococcus landrumensis TaxID=2813577 RepID=A0ABX7N299_9BACT|nr:tetratricopeptide repeat protein [Myxococcus landrumus]QSQ12836.1 tetratricopeptide repeat protein [Myxococcus landrumus]